MPPAPFEVADELDAINIYSIPIVRRRVLVTGAAGFIGFHTAKALLARGDDVVIIDELNDYYDVKLKQNNLDWLSITYGSRVTLFIGDICNQQLVRCVLKETKAESIVHFAARAGVRPCIDNPLMYIQANVVDTMVLLDACREFGVTKFVYESSSSVYGGSLKDRFSVEDIVDFPVSPYAATKKSCELLAHTYNHLHGMDTIGLPFFTVYGPRGRPDMAPFKFMDRIARGVAIDQYGDGSSSRDITFIEDIVQGVVLSLDHGRIQSWTRLTHVVNGLHLVFERLVGKKAKINITPNHPGDVPRTSADISKAEKLLRYKPTTSL
ncbi:hypothetical protein PsorP6_007833 [Peronosclerospora sorghi]|uniref:Uncharacterized protein n=1 Tax=Peronosclerospora sorghi TaxID=230839 RepID=A0ACC0WAT0_9STRA|nr:hypothetical protein PsorP6_007833 [Peronosclerospora sorghi]